MDVHNAFRMVHANCRRLAEDENGKGTKIELMIMGIVGRHRGS